MSTIKNSLEQQGDYVDSLHRSKFKFGLTVGAAFIRGIRDIGYKSVGTALDELVDNAFQADAENVHVAFGFEGTKSEKKPAEVAVIDDGHGMIPDMIRLAVMWGGTHRENDRTGLGRFGYGLPSACVSQGRRFTVYSVPEGGTMHGVTIDIDEIAEGRYTNPDGDIVVPAPCKAKLPRFVEEHIKAHWPGGRWSHGTVVVIEKFDRITKKTSGALQNFLLEHFGVIYHKLRHRIDLQVNDKRVEPVDPLFLTPGYRWYDLDADRAQALDPLRIDVRDPETREVAGQIEVRYAYMPPTFASIDKNWDPEKGRIRGAIGKNANERFNILKEHNGFIFSRMGRIIDVVSHSPLTTFVNNDRYIKIEIDFPAVLDEEFNIPTSKQRVDVSERIWNILKENGLLKALEQLRKRFKEEKARLADDKERKPEQKRPSEEAMERTAELAPVPAPAITTKRLEEGRRRLRQEAERRAARSDKTVEEAVRELEFELGGRLYKVAHESVPGAPFFRVEQIGGTKVLFLNTASRFYQEVHSGPNSNPALRGALEILLFAIGDRMLEGGETLKDFYAHEVPEWSRKLEFALGQLASGIGAPDSDHGEDRPLDAAA